MILRKTEIVSGKALTITISTPENASVYWQVVNPLTGKGWQKHRDIQVFSGTLATMRALQAYNRMKREATRYA